MYTESETTPKKHETGLTQRTRTSIFGSGSRNPLGWDSVFWREHLGRTIPGKLRPILIDWGRVMAKKHSKSIAKKASAISYHERN